jgi:energy-coupling factor transporter ATP-binding protein EcfA2
VTHSGACGLRGVDGPIPAGRANALPPSDDALPAALDSLIAEAQMSCAEPASETLHAIRDRLAQPPRVAVVGRVSSGKSTLVNALLGVRAAPTGAGETTTLAHWYRWGRLSTATLVTATGPVPLPEFEDGVPDDLPVPVDRIERIEVTRPVPLLRQLTVIDTPGLASAGAGSDPVPRHRGARRCAAGRHSRAGPRGGRHDAGRPAVARRPGAGMAARLGRSRRRAVTRKPGCRERHAVVSYSKR